MIKNLKDNQDWLTKIVCSLSYEVGDEMCQLEQAQTVEGGPEAEQNCGHLSQEAPPITTQQVQCLVDSWGHMMHMRNLIDLRHSICLFGSLVSLPFPSVPVWLLIKYFFHQLFICLPQIVSSKLKVISKISTRWNRDRGVFFFFLLCFISTRHLLCMRVRGSWCDLTLPPHGDYSANPTCIPADDHDSPSASLPGRSHCSALFFPPT